MTKPRDPNAATETLAEELCHRASLGDRAAYEQLFAMHFDRALLFVRTRLGPKLRQKLDSVDVLQDAFLAAHEKFGDFTPRDAQSFFFWLCRIIDHRICNLGDYFGARKREPVELPRELPMGLSTAMDRAEQREKIARALEELTEEHRQVLLLRYFQGMTAEEVGQTMNKSAGAVRKMTARALIELGKRL